MSHRSLSVICADGMYKFRLKNAFVRLLVFLGTGLTSVWLFQTSTHHGELIQQTPRIPPTVASNAPTAQEPEQLFGIFVDDDRLVHHGYEVRRVTDQNEVSYAVVRRNGRTLAKFDGVYYPRGNTTDFGLFDFRKENLST